MKVRVLDWIEVTYGDEVEGTKVVCKRCKAQAVFYTDVKEKRREFVEDFIRGHKKCRECSDGKCEL